VLACDSDFSFIGRNATCVAASSEVRQAYKQFIGAVVELLSGEAVSEELYEVAQTVYTLFGGDDTEYVAAERALSKR
jgi:activating signal cointegrator complex subunit 3